MWTYLLGGHQSPHYKIETSLPGGRGGVGNALQEVSVISGERGHCGGSGRWGAQRCLRARDLAWQVQRQPDAAGKSLELRSQVYRGAMVWIAVLEGPALPAHWNHLKLSPTRMPGSVPGVRRDCSGK